MTTVENQSSRQRSVTPIEFRDMLIKMASS